MNKNTVYWEKIKNHYENKYDGIYPGKKADKYALEIKNGLEKIGGDYALAIDDLYNYNKLVDVFEQLRDRANDEANGEEFIDISETETYKLFPSISDYYKFSDEISAYFMFEKLKEFEYEITNGNQEYVNIALDLKWEYMLEKIPDLANIFLF